MSENLWGELGDISIEKTPSMILKEQANMLSNLTDGAIEGVVERGQYVATTSLYIQAPSISNYKVKIVEIEYMGDSPYPLRISDRHRATATEISDEVKFIASLEEILKSDATQSAMAFMLAEVKSGV